MGQSSYNPGNSGGGGGDSLWQFVTNMLLPTNIVLSTITDFFVGVGNWVIDISTTSGIGAFGFINGNTLAAMVITSPNQIDVVSTDSATYGNGLEVDETQFVLNTSDQAGGEYGIGSNLADESVIMNAVKAGNANQLEVSLDEIDFAFNSAIIFGINNDGKIKTNQVVAGVGVMPATTIAKMPIYSPAGTLIGNIQITT
jgi:hypothetical protein